MTVWSRLSVVALSIEFFYNSWFSGKSWQNPASIDGEEQNKKIAPTGDWTHNGITEKHVCVLFASVPQPSMNVSVKRLQKSVLQCLYL